MGSRALLIDFGGTLDADGLPWVDRFFDLYASAGGARSRAEFQAAFLASDVALATIPGVETFDYSDTVIAQAGLLADLLPDGVTMRAPQICDALIGDAMTAAARNRPVLESLADRYALAVVSNFQGNLGPCLDELELGSVFDVLVDSEVVGFRKPDSRIFAFTLQALDCTPAECWMIGDSPPNDIAGAAAAGLRTCWIAPASRHVTGTVPTSRIARFDQVERAVAA